MEAVIRSITGCCSTRHATDNSIPPWVRRVCRTPSPGCSERLEPDIGKLICPVLRGGGGGNVVPLLDTMKLTPRAGAGDTIRRPYKAHGAKVDEETRIMTTPTRPGANDPCRA